MKKWIPFIFVMIVMAIFAFMTFKSINELKTANHQQNEITQTKQKLFEMNIMQAELFNQAAIYLINHNPEHLKRIEVAKSVIDALFKNLNTSSYVMQNGLSQPINDAYQMFNQSFSTMFNIIKDKKISQQKANMFAIAFEMNQVSMRKLQETNQSLSSQTTSFSEITKLTTIQFSVLIALFIMINLIYYKSQNQHKQSEKQEPIFNHENLLIKQEGIDLREPINDIIQVFQELQDTQSNIAENICENMSMKDSLNRHKLLRNRLQNIFKAIKLLESSFVLANQHVSDSDVKKKITLSLALIQKIGLTIGSMDQYMIKSGDYLQEKEEKSKALHLTFKENSNKRLQRIHQNLSLLLEKQGSLT